MDDGTVHCFGLLVVLIPAAAAVAAAAAFAGAGAGCGVVSVFLIDADDVVHHLWLQELERLRAKPCRRCWS